MKSLELVTLKLAILQIPKVDKPARNVGNAQDSDTLGSRGTFARCAVTSFLRYFGDLNRFVLPSQFDEVVIQHRRKQRFRFRPSFMSQVCDLLCAVQALLDTGDDATLLVKRRDWQMDRLQLGFGNVAKPDSA